MVSKRPATPPPITLEISTLKRGGDVIKLFARKNNSPTSRLSIRKTAATLDKITMEVTLRDREIKRLQTQLDQMNPPKRCKVVQDPNERFVSLVQVLAQANQEPQQRVRRAEIVTVEEDNSSELEKELMLARRSARNWRPTKHYIERDFSTDEESN